MNCLPLTTKFVLLTGAVLLVAAPIPAADDATWTQWRGPSRDGRISGPTWPGTLEQEQLALEWSAPLGPSYSGPIVSSDRIFVTETKDKKFELVRAFDRSNGKQIWETQWEGSMSVPFFAASNGSWIRATPALEGERLYVGGMRDMLVCLDAGSGKTVWKVDFVATMNSAPPTFGFVSSPLVHGDSVYVQAGGGVVRLDKLTGKILWKSLDDGGGMDGSAFSSPVIATIAGQEQLVVQSRTRLAGVSLQDGSVYWSQEIPAFRGMNILTPTVIGDSIFTSSYGGKSALLGIVRNGSGWQVSEVWTHKSQGYMSSPVVVGEQIYLHLRNQRCVCLDAATGKERWTTTPFGKYWSLIANGDKLLALDQNGELLLIQASPDAFKLIARRKVAEDSWAHLAIAGDQLVVRDLDAVKTFRWHP
jgi:outer membrane protein assembly factor BamB